MYRLLFEYCDKYKETVVPIARQVHGTGLDLQKLKEFEKTQLEILYNLDQLEIDITHVNKNTERKLRHIVEQTDHPISIIGLARNLGHIYEPKIMKALG